MIFDNSKAIVTRNFISNAKHSIIKQYSEVDDHDNFFGDTDNGPKILSGPDALPVSAIPMYFPEGVHPPDY